MKKLLGDYKLRPRFDGSATSKYVSNGARNFRRTEFSPDKKFVVRIFCRMNIGYINFHKLIYSFDFIITDVFSIFHRAARLLRCFTYFQIDPLSTNIFCLFHVKFLTNISVLADRTGWYSSESESHPSDINENWGLYIRLNRFWTFKLNHF